MWKYIKPQEEGVQNPQTDLNMCEIICEQI